MSIQVNSTDLFWAPHQYQPVVTADESPSLRWLGAETQESMHHSGGAYTETQMIYGDPLREVFKDVGECEGDRKNLSVISVGLGLGYIEYLAVVESLKFEKKLKLLTFEADEFLVQTFLRWLRGEEFLGAVVYDKMANYFDDVEVQKVKSKMIEMYEDKTWIIEGALTPELKFEGRYNLICYDAFSSKTSPYLWQEDFLKAFLNKASDTSCCFSTYACTGVLKKSLRESGFELIKRRGFMNKKHSTLARKI